MKYILAALGPVVLLRFAIALAVVLGVAAGVGVLSSCSPRTGSPLGDVETFSCNDDGVDEVLRSAVEQWPDIAGVVDRLDVFCEPREAIQRSSRCGRAEATDIDACTMWLHMGSGPFDSARVYVADDVSVRAALAHEAQHWRPEVWALPDACAHHTPDCWDADAEAALKRK